ncbi:MAG TPA: class I SAM-dependent methyltransferase [Bryobacteraceae bacterium]|jgi:ubiquinone/menaquinone biosynthesis C-methylase UbiE|nr:class I SAM-dependent methyltransferase [Bryobacteraceae bacterium]
MILILALLLLSPALRAQGVHPVTGRQIAGVMSAAGSNWLDRPEREEEEEPDKALEAIGIRRGMIIADVGSGSGFMSFKMAKLVGPSGKVYANDIQPEMLAIVQARARQSKITNVETVLGTDRDPKLPAGTIDLILLVDVYHEFSHPQAMLDRMRESLKPGGRLVLLEYRKEDPTVPIRPEHKMSVAEVKAELEPEGFQFDQTIEVLPRQHILIFRPRRN